MRQYEEMGLIGGGSNQNSFMIDNQRFGNTGSQIGVSNLGNAANQPRSLMSAMNQAF